MAQIGSFLLLLSLALSGYSFLFGLIALLRRDTLFILIGETARRAGIASFIAVLLAGGILVNAAFTNDFSIAYIFQHSNRDLPGPYKFATLWSGQEGSLLFWALLLSGYGFVLRLRHKTDERLFAHASVIMAAVQVFFFLLLNFAARPFSMTQGQPQLDGAGLNPLLQYPEMVIHPPMLYLGYVGFTVPFAFALGALIMRIDAHQHFWRYHPDEYNWIDDSMFALRRDFLPADLRPELLAIDFDACVAVQARQTLPETRWLLQLSDSTPFIAGVVGWADLRAENVRDQLGEFSKNPKLLGVRHIVQAERDDRFLLRPDFLRGIAALEEFDLTYDILIYPRQLPVAIEFVHRFPKQRFVLDHLGKPLIKAETIEPWSSHIRELAKFPNVFCKLSGMVTEADWKSWGPLAWTSLPQPSQTRESNRPRCAACLPRVAHHKALQVVSPQPLPQ